MAIKMPQETSFGDVSWFQILSCEPSTIPYHIPGAS